MENSFNKNIKTIKSGRKTHVHMCTCAMDNDYWRELADKESNLRTSVLFSQFLQEQLFGSFRETFG